MVVFSTPFSQVSGHLFAVQRANHQPMIGGSRLSSKALLYRCAASRAGCYGRGDCRRRPTTPWSSKCAGQVYVVGAEEFQPPTSSVSDPPRISPLEFETVRHSEEPCRNRRSTALSARRLAHDSRWFVCARTGPSGRRLLPVCCRWWTLDSFDTSTSRPGSLPSRGGVSRVCVGRPYSRGAAPCCRQGAPAHVRDVLSEPGRTRIMRNPGLQLLRSRTWSNRRFGPCVASSTDR